MITENSVIDLGLPSGTLWTESNEEGLYTFDEAVSKYGDSLPTYEQFEELKEKCQWEWMGGGYKVTGPNGKSIVLPAEGYRGCNGGVFMDSYGDYWSSTLTGSCIAWYLFFNFSSVCMLEDNRGYGFSVRLVKDKDNNIENKELNIAEILKDCPKGTKLYSPLFGEVEFYFVENNEDMNNCDIVVLDPRDPFYPNEDLSRVSFSSDGRWFYGYGECMLFPSKKNRDWSTFKVPKKEPEFKPFDKVLVRDFDN